MAPQGVAHPIGSQALKTESILTQSRKGRKEGQNPCVSRQDAQDAKKNAADDFFGLWPTHHFFSQFFASFAAWRGSEVALAVIAVSGEHKKTGSLGQPRSRLFTFLRQPGCLLKTRGFPSPPRGGFGFFFKL
jgi:hypothetical protein